MSRLIFAPSYIEPIGTRKCVCETQCSQPYACLLGPGINGLITDGKQSYVVEALF